MISERNKKDVGENMKFLVLTFSLLFSFSVFSQNLVSPKVTFSVISFDEMIPNLIYFVTRDRGTQWDWSHYIFKYYPSLETELESNNGPASEEDIVNSYFARVYNDRSVELVAKKEEIQEKWDEINDELMLTLASVVEIEWPVFLKDFSARISLNPICPRFLNKNTFDIFYQSPINGKIHTTTHELLHFIYFWKWKNVFPNVNSREFNSPYMVWHLSEMVTGVILNDPRIQKIIQYPSHTYGIYERTKVKGKPLTSYLSEFYNARKDFRDFLLTSYQFLLNNEEEIEKAVGEMPIMTYQRIIN